MFDGLLLPSLRSTRPARLELDARDSINRDRLCWPLTEPGGKLADELSPRHQRGTLFNTPTRVVSPYGRATNFSGGGASSPYINVGKAGAAQLPFTFTAWVKVVSTAGYDTIFGQYTDYATSGGIGKMLRSDLGTMTYYTTSSAAAYQSVTGGAVTAGVWTFVAITLDGPITGPTYKFVVNRSISTGTLSQLYAGGPIVSDIYLGNSERNTLFGPSEGLNGTMQLASMWPRGLPASDLLRLYRDPLAGLIDPADRLFIAFKAGATGVTVALTGIGSTFSAGTLIANHANPLTGSAITGAAGTLLPTRSLPLTGAAITAGQGTVTPSSTLPLTGSAATATPGTLTANRSLPITGTAATASAGMVTPGMSFALSGQPLSSAAGTVATSRVLSITGQAITSGIGTVSIGSDVAVALTGLAITSASGTLAVGLAVAIAGSAMALSAGSLAYSARFTLAGVSTATASGAVGVSGGGATVDAALVGLSISVQPGNVKVTGGTKWVPQAARAVAIATAVGNTLPPPPRLTGDTKSDIQAQGQWLATLYDQLVKVNNVFGRINDHETRIATLEASNDNTH